MRLLLTTLVSIVGICSVANATPLSGTRTIGPSGNYPSIGAAITDIQVQTLDGPLILELQSTYVSSVETFPLTFANLSTSAVNTLTLRPANGAAGISVTSANTTAATVDLNGAKFLIIDGRPGGAGVTSHLTIANTSTSGRALRFINEASNNAVRYTTLRGVNTSATNGIVVFSTTTGANGNDDNTLDRCDIRDGASTPTNCLYGLGTTTTLAQNNSGNTVSNCNIFNFYSTGANAVGALIEGGNSNWTFAGNSFYQTSVRAPATYSVQGIYINNTSGNNFIIHDNFIGGSAPDAEGAPWTTSGTLVPYVFQGIRVNVGTTTSSSIQGNVVGNILWSTSGAPPSLPSVWCGIYLEGGNVNVGTVTGNTIGSGTGTGSVTVTTSGANNYTFGIGSTSSGTVTISNNTIGSVTVNGTTANAAGSIAGIRVDAGTNTISSNIVGSASVPNPLTSNANSLNAANPTTNSSNDQEVMGIISNSSVSTVITGNIVANLNNNAVQFGRFGKVWGIGTSAGVNTISGNTVRNLTTTSPNTSPDYLQGVCGILDRSSAAGQNISQNTVHSLASRASTGAILVNGIYFTGPSSGTNLIERNFVHSLEASSSSASSQVAGISVNYAFVTVRNNMVRLGLGADGASTAGASMIHGLLDGNTYKERSYYHNSVHVGGVQTSGAARTDGLTTLDAQGTRIYQNNILVNTRSNSGGTGKHYAVYHYSTGMVSNGNIYLATGNGSVLGYCSGDRATLAAWRTYTSQDSSSLVANPFFVAPAGDALTVNLHLRPDNPAEQAGIAVAAVTDDFDGEVRGTLTPHDIGADAGAFTTLEGVAPTITTPPLSNATSVNRVLTGWADIRDNNAVASGANAPRLYFKKATDADVFGVSNDMAGDGWKYVSAIGSGPYVFTLDYSLLAGGGVSIGDSIQYFVVAQDTANNFASSPPGATAAVDSPVQNVSGHGAVNSFNIVGGGISGEVTVGEGGTYSSLTGPGGLFAALNGAVLTDNLVVQVTSDLVETGGVMLNQANSNNYPLATVTIRPDSPVMRTISGAVAGGLISFNGADRVIIDGRTGGAGRYLTFRNTSTSASAATLLLINDACENTVSNCIAEGAGTSTSLGVIAFSTGTTSGNDSNLITGCQVRDLSSSAGVPRNAIGSNGTSSTVSNSFNTISNNEVFNFNSFGIYAASTGNDSWTVAGNNVYLVNAATNSATGINMWGGGVQHITGNSVRDLVTTSTSTSSIRFGGTGTMNIWGNRITTRNVNATTTTIYGIEASGGAGSTVNIVNNQVTLIPMMPISTTIEGIFQFGSVPVTINAFHNSVVLGGAETGTRSSWASRRIVATSYTARNNIFLNLRTGGTGNHLALSSQVSGGSLAVSNNVYAGTGATPANFMGFSTTGTEVPVTFEQWQSNAIDTNSQAGIGGAASFTTAIFVDALDGNLHLVPSSLSLVGGMGIVVPGVTTDYDGDVRSTTAPWIGADELLWPDMTVTQSASLVDGVSNVDFGTVVIGNSGVEKTFTVTNTGTSELTSVVINKDGADANDFFIGAISNTTIPVGGTAVFSVTFVPTGGGMRSAALHIASNINGTKNPFDVTLTGVSQSAFQAWALANGVSSDPSSNSGESLLSFAFGRIPGQSGPLIYVGALSGGGTIGATGSPIVRSEHQETGDEYRALFVRRLDYLSAGLTYTPQFSSDLGTWQNSTAVPTVLADDGINQIVSVPFPVAAPGQGKQFFKLSVSVTP